MVAVAPKSAHLWQKEQYLDPAKRMGWAIRYADEVWWSRVKWLDRLTQKVS